MIGFCVELQCKFQFVFWHLQCYQWDFFMFQILSIIIRVCCMQPEFLLYQYFNIVQRLCCSCRQLLWLFKCTFFIFYIIIFPNHSILYFSWFFCPSAVQTCTHHLLTCPEQLMFVLILNTHAFRLSFLHDCETVSGPQFSLSDQSILCH